MKRVAVVLCLLSRANAVSTAAGQDLYTDFALVVQLPSYEAFLTNLGDSPIRVDGYMITSPSGSLSPTGWKGMSSSGPEVVAALGPGAAQFFAANPNINSLTELNPISSATWQPGQAWSIGFPFNSGDAGFARDAVFRFSSPDGFVLTGGTVIPPGQLFPAALLVVPEPTSGMLCLLGTIAIVAIQFRVYRTWRRHSR
jgi:hypothetical protein